MPAGANEHEWHLIFDQNAPGRKISGASAYCAERDSVILFGGYTFAQDHTVEANADIWEYRFATQQWERVPYVAHSIVPSPRMSFTLTTLPTDDDELDESKCSLLMVGGRHTAAESGERDQVIAEKYVWLLQVSATADEKTVASWQALENLEKAMSSRSNHAAVMQGSKVYLFGGLDEHRQPTNKLQVLDWNLLQAESLPNLPGSPPPVHSHSLVHHNGDLILSGGYTLNGMMMNNIYMFNIKAGKWKQISGLPQPRAFAATWVNHDGLMVSYGGVADLSNRHTFDQFIVTDLNKLRIGAPQPCAGNDSVTLSSKPEERQIWCQESVSDPRLQHRYDFAWCHNTKQDTMIVYGGRSVNPLQDFWELNLAQVDSPFVQPPALENVSGWMIFLKVNLAIASVVLLLCACKMWRIWCKQKTAAGGSSEPNDKNLEEDGFTDAENGDVGQVHRKPKRRNSLEQAIETVKNTMQRFSSATSTDGANQERRMDIHPEGRVPSSQDVLGSIREKLHRHGTNEGPADNARTFLEYTSMDTPPKSYAKDGKPHSAVPPRLDERTGGLSPNSPGGLLARELGGFDDMEDIKGSSYTVSRQ